MGRRSFTESKVACDSLECKIWRLGRIQEIPILCVFTDTGFLNEDKSQVVLR
jgi:hypothetical protein